MRCKLYQYSASYVEHDARLLGEILITVFRFVTLNDISLSFKINCNFTHNHIAILMVSSEISSFRSIRIDIIDGLETMRFSET